MSYSNSPVFIEAVNDSRFLRTFGIICLIGSVLLFIGPGVALGVGLAVMGYGSSRYYRILGLTIAVLALIGFFSTQLLKLPVSILGSAVLCVGICVKGWNVLRDLGTGDKNDPDWEPTRKRTIVGVVTSILGLLISIAWLLLYILGQFLSSRT